MKSRPTTAEYERLLAICRVLSDRVSTTEQTVAELCALAGVPPPPVLASDWMTVKSAMYITGYSQSNIWKLIKRGRLVAVKRGGRVLICSASVAKFGNKESDAYTDGRAPCLRHEAKQT